MAFLVYFQNKIVDVVKDQPTLPSGSRYSVLQDTPENRATIAAWAPTLTPRQQAAATMKAQPVEVRTAFATAWVTINTLLDFGDKAGALAYFDALPIPTELQAQAAEIRALLAAI